MAASLATAPALFTPDTHILDEISPVAYTRKKLSDEQLSVKYEITRTIREIRSHGWRRVALQFPDDMLRDSARIFQLLARGLEPALKALPEPAHGHPDTLSSAGTSNSKEAGTPVKLTILADTSYGSCCVDEVAAEHVEAEAIIHYGRACLSPTARLPVIYIFTQNDLDINQLQTSFVELYPELLSKVIISADVTYSSNVEKLYAALSQAGYTQLFATSIIHDPSSPIPNRTVPPSVEGNEEQLKQWQLFHISEPPTSLLITLSSRLTGIYIYPTSVEPVSGSPRALVSSTTSLLRRRYALVTALSTVSIWGILINTLSVKNYLHIVEHVKSQIAAAGKKSYLMVVGKLNAAKVANFSEIGGWVVIGCWESSLVDSKDFYRPVITPFELGLALARVEDRVWTGDWRGDFQGVLDDAGTAAVRHTRSSIEDAAAKDEENGEDGDFDSEEESAPPEFDLRTGRYISHTRPMQIRRRVDVSGDTNMDQQVTALTRRAKGEMVSVNGIASPAAEYLKAQRTWKGLGSDFEVKYEDDDRGSSVEEGRSGVARGYTVGDSDRT